MDPSDQATNTVLYTNHVHVTEQAMPELELRIKRNSLLPISRLPEEMMAKIFLSLARLPQDRGPSKSWDWLTLTKVCSQWRKIALGHASLWTEIKSPVHKDRVKAFLERSNQAELTVDFRSHEMRPPILSDILKLIIHHMHRVQGLYIYKEEAEWDDIQELFRENPVSHLKHLCLDASSSCYDPRYDIPTTVQLKKLALIQPVRPLEEISLTSIAIPWNSTIFRGLTCLGLYFMKEEFHMTINELLDILAASPNLQKLDLSNAGPRLSQTHRKTGDIKLHQLKTIKISRIEYETLVKLISGLDFPRDIDWEIEEVSRFTGSESFPKNLLDRSTFCDQLELAIDDDVLFISQVHADSNTLQVSRYRCPRVTLGLDFEQASMQQQEIISLFQSLETYFAHPFFSKVTEVTLRLTDMSRGYHMAPITRAAWSHVFSSFPNLRRLYIWFTGEEDTGLEMYLINALTGSRNIQSDSIVCSELEDLEIFNATFSESSGLGRRAYKKLIKNLISRRKYQKPLKSLKFNYCGIDEIELEEMRNLELAEIIIVL